MEGSISPWECVSSYSATVWKDAHDVFFRRRPGRTATRCISDKGFLFRANYNIHIGLISLLQPIAFSYEILGALVEVLASPITLWRGLLRLSRHVEER